MFKCLCCSGGGGRHRREDGGGTRSHKFSLENVQAAADAQASGPTASGRYLRKKLDDDRLDRFDGAPMQRPVPAVEIGGGAGARSSGGKAIRPGAPVPKQFAPPPPPPPAPLPVVPVKQRVNLPDPGKDHVEDPAVDIVEEVLALRVEQQYTVEQPRSSAPKSSSGSSEEEEEEQIPPPALQTSHRQPQDHLHGSTVFQSDENETTIVDSDYSDYEDDGELKLRPAAESGHAARTTVTLSVILPRRRSDRDEDVEEHQLKEAAERLSTFLLAEEDDDDEGSGVNFGWQTLPNSLRSRGGHLTHHQPLLETLVEEEPIAVNALPPQSTGSEADDNDDEEDVVPVSLPPPPPPTQKLSYDDEPAMARESLLALDQALAVFELASIYDEPTDFAAHSHATINGGFDEQLVDEEIIQPSPRNS